MQNTHNSIASSIKWLFRLPTFQKFIQKSPKFKKQIHW